jgi:hypothetical protein
VLGSSQGSTDTSGQNGVASPFLGALPSLQRAGLARRSLSPETSPVSPVPFVSIGSVISVTICFFEDQHLFCNNIVDVVMRRELI